ncbi:MAG: histidine kinase [Clostridia bacterium]|nr:histidine kinase [Clostridia bacterium]
MRKTKTSSILNSMNLNTKFMVIYVVCIIFPLILTDGFILRALYNEETSNARHVREAEAQAVYDSVIYSAWNYDFAFASAIDRNKGINRFLDKSYASPYDFYSAYRENVSDSFFESFSGLRSDRVVIFADNPTILNGGKFRPLSSAQNEEWYKRFIALDTDEATLVFYDRTERFLDQKKFMYIKRMTENKSSIEKIITITNNYSSMMNSLDGIPTSSGDAIYVVTNKYIPISNQGDNIIYTDIKERIERGRNMTVKECKLNSTEFKIYVFSDEVMVLSVIRNNSRFLFPLILLTLILPLLVMKLIENSILRRINQLQDAFVGNRSQTFRTIEDIDGNDEIASLMINYNNMVRLNNELTNTIYKEKLKDQQNHIARKNAELLALQSQINPHFLFNALESIRMHSILKGEDETAEMVEKLAVMERQNVDWQHDSVTVGEETEFIKAYLQLQSYRFGDRLTFDIDIAEGCEDYLIPKLTLVTFVENACVHGIESKSSQGWIFVRVYRDKDNEYLYIEVEDTGDGMSEAEVQKLAKRMNSVTIDTIKKVRHVGILNACLRMKMMFDDKAKFYVDSEQGVGMAVVIKIPIENITKRG